MIKTIIVPVDGSTHSKKALEFAVDLAVKFRAGLHLIHVVQAPVTTHVLTLGAASIMVGSTRKELDTAGDAVINAARDLAQRSSCRDISVEVAGGDPAAMILKSAAEHEADMIVMGNRGLSDLAGLMLGSVSHKVSHLASCTCVTVK